MYRATQARAYRGRSGLPRGAVSQEDQQSEQAPRRRRRGARAQRDTEDAATEEGARPP